MEYSKNLQGADLVRWIENKLGNLTGWKISHASSILTREILVELETCFCDLEPSVKSKIIQSFIYFSSKKITDWKEPIQKLILIARTDADDWVETISDMLRDFPIKQSICSVSFKDDSFLNRTSSDLLNLFKKPEAHFPKILPPGSLYSSHHKNYSQYGYKQVTLHDHFKKKSNLKFDSLLNDVTKALEHQKNPGIKRASVSTIPIKMRSTAKKINNFPMKGIPSSTPKMSSGFSNDQKRFQKRSHINRDGGAVLLDISDIPDPKKRKRAVAQTASNDQLNNNDDSLNEFNDECQNYKMDVNLMDNSLQNKSSDGLESMIFPDELKHYEPLFKDANKLTQESLDIILSFLSGNKENPLEEKFGQIVMLPLSQTIEKACSSDGTEKSYYIETYFQMDYRNFEWKRLRKSKLIIEIE